VSALHNIAIVTSIHQPNNDLIMTFDKLYVLAKGGFCVYEGSPKYLEFHLSKAEITCSQYQIPIEVLIRICSKTDGSAQRMTKMLLKRKNELRYRCETEGRLSPGGISQKAIALNLFHFWYILQRTVVYTLSSNWKSMAIHFLLCISLSIVVPLLFNRQIGELDGCQNHNSRELFKEDPLLLIRNQGFIFFTMIVIQLLTTVSTLLVFGKEVKVFLNEKRNGKKSQ
jgi:hypothetical protein